MRATFGRARAEPVLRRALPARAEARTRLARLAVVVVASVLVSPLLAHGAPTRIYVVASGSMEPAIPTGSLVIVEPGIPDVGDVIVFWSPVGSYQVHRVVKVEEVDGRRMVQTRGDANDGSDSFLVPQEDIRGLVNWHVPYAGYLWLVPARVHIATFTAFAMLYLAITVWDARAARRGHLVGAAVVSLVLLLPSALAAVVSSYPGSTFTAAVATTPLPMAAGTMASASIASDQNSATVTAAAPRLWKEITMWNCQKDSTCALTVNSNGYGEQLGSWVRINVADYGPSPTFYFEAYLKAGSGGTTYVILRDKSGGADVAASEVTTTSTSLTLVRSGSFTLTGDKDYTIRTKKASASGELDHARLVLVQDLPTKTVEQVRLMQGDESVSTSWSVPNRAVKWRYDGSSTDGVTAAYFETVAEVDGNMLTDSQVRLVDRTTGGVVATLTVDIFDTAATRFRSADIKASLVDGHEYEVEANRGDGLLNDKLKIYVARVIVLQSSFTKTVRYVDLSWTVTSTSTTFATQGYPGKYQVGTEWGGLTGYFEVTMKNSGAAGTSSAVLYDNGASATVAGSQVDVTGTTRTRVRSGAITLSTTEVNYAAQLKATSGTAEIRNAWLIVLQGPGKTYDHALKTTNNVAGGCTWSFTLAHTSSSNLARLRTGTITLRGDGGTQDQIKVVSGALTQSSGTAVSTAYGNTLQHVVTTDPTSSGTSTIQADLQGTCTGYGIRTVQPVTYSLT